MLAVEILRAAPRLEAERTIRLDGAESRLTAGELAALRQFGARLEAGLAPFGTVQRVGAMLTLFCRDEPVRDHEDAGACDTDRFGALFRHLLQGGIYVPPSQFECLFPSTSHIDDDVERTVAAVEAFAETSTA